MNKDKKKDCSIHIKGKVTRFRGGKEEKKMTKKCNGFGGLYDSQIR